MRNLFIRLVLCCGALSSQAQLSLHLSAYTGNKIGLETKPYGKSTLEVPIFYGGEIGFRFLKKIELRGFVYSGDADKGMWFRSGKGSSSFLRWGFGPQITVLSTGSGIMNLDIGISVSSIEEETKWKDHVVIGRSSNMLGHSNIYAHARGVDQAKYTALSLSPKGRLYFKRPRIGLEFGFDYNFYFLQSAHRKVYQNEIPDENFRDEKLSFNKQSLTAHIGISYFFW